QPRIFLGGLSAMVGPQTVGFGSLTVAGQVIRRAVPANRIVGDVSQKVDRDITEMTMSPERVLGLNLAYIGQLAALQAWYREVRLARIPDDGEHGHIAVVTAAAADLLSTCIAERVQRLREFLEERSRPLPRLSFAAPPCPLKVELNLP